MIHHVQVVRTPDLDATCRCRKQQSGIKVLLFSHLTICLPVRYNLIRLSTQVSSASR